MAPSFALGQIHVFASPAGVRPAGRTIKKAADQQAGGFRLSAKTIRHMEKRILKRWTVVKMPRSV